MSYLLPLSNFKHQVDYYVAVFGWWMAKFGILAPALMNGKFEVFFFFFFFYSCQDMIFFFLDEEFPFSIVSAFSSPPTYILTISPLTYIVTITLAPALSVLAVYVRFIIRMAHRFCRKKITVLISKVCVCVCVQGGGGILLFIVKWWPPCQSEQEYSTDFTYMQDGQGKRHLVWKIKIVSQLVS